jgi:hypothetical protein
MAKSDDQHLGEEWDYAEADDDVTRVDPESIWGVVEVLSIYHMVWCIAQTQSQGAC